MQDSLAGSFGGSARHHATRSAAASSAIASIAMGVDSTAKSIAIFAARPSMPGSIGGEMDDMGNVGVECKKVTTRRWFLATLEILFHTRVAEMGSLREGWHKQMTSGCGMCSGDNIDGVRPVTDKGAGASREPHG